MKRKLIVAAASISLLFAGIQGVTGDNSAQANSIDEKMNDVKEKREKNRSAKGEAEAEIEAIKKDQAQLKSQIKSLDQQVQAAQNRITAKETDIATTKREIETLKAEIDVLIKRIAKRDKMLKERVTAMYENGGSVQYIEVLLGSSNFGDFLDRVFALNQIAEQDKQILEAHKADKTKLDDSKIKIEQELDTLNQQMNELQTMKGNLDAKVEQKNVLLGNLEDKEEQMHAHLTELEDKADLLSKQQNALEAEKQRQLEKEKEKEKEKEDEDESETPASSDGDFMKPADGMFTSGLGMRWGNFHAGIDIAKSGTVPVVASASGTVIKSYKSSSYGNVIFLAHYVDGKTYTTVYAHLNDRHVGNGETVEKGQQIGIMGNTGHSTGQHLHFELHKGEWNSSKSNAINPRKFF